MRLKLRKMRKARKLTLQQLAEMTGISWNSLAKYEKGSVVPGLDKAAKLARVLGVKVDDLIEGDQA